MPSGVRSKCVACDANEDRSQSDSSKEKNCRLPAPKALTKCSRNSRRNKRESTRTGRKNPSGEEANAYPVYKAKLLVATEEDTVRTILFGHGWPNAPHRTLRTPFVEQWLSHENETQDSRAESLRDLCFIFTKCGQTDPCPERWPPNNKTNNIQLRPAISITVDSL
jgi:hypothetical protein